MTNPFESRVSSLNGPARDAAPVTPDDGADLAQTAVALYVETGGALSVITVTGATRTLNVADHSILPLGVRRVLATGTTAAGIHALLIG
jgi:hypothetical protein